MALPPPVSTNDHNERMTMIGKLLCNLGLHRRRVQIIVDASNIDDYPLIQAVHRCKRRGCRVVL